MGFNRLIIYIVLNSRVAQTCNASSLTWKKVKQEADRRAAEVLEAQNYEASATFLIHLTGVELPLIDYRGSDNTFPVFIAAH